jgi:tyrosinase
MYVHHFEKIVARHVRELGGPSNWALPYWNYSASAAQRLLPAPFRTGGPLTELFVLEREPGANAGLDFIPVADADLTLCMSEPTFSGTGGGGTNGFGGGATAFNHFGGSASGVCELVPHNRIHVRTGGNPGEFMGDPNTAALDPIFWLHHANIDRLWEVWRRRDPVHTNPTTRAWRRAVSFSFRDSRRRAVDMIPQQVVNTAVPPLSYVYDDVSDPLAPPP